MKAGIHAPAISPFAIKCSNSEPLPFDDETLGAIAFGSTPRAMPDVPCVAVDIPVLDGETVFEVWTSAESVTRLTVQDIAISHTRSILYGCLSVEEDSSLDQTTYFAYCRIFDALDELGFHHLLRAWNYFPNINADAGTLERYRRFNIGRHDAFVDKRGAIGEHAPASCALGTRSGALTIAFLAGRNAGLPVENPRQTSAYEYPTHYGPRSPAFSRAMRVQLDEKPVLLISGTASIVGHRTLHAGHVELQIDETIANLEALIDHAGFNGHDTLAQRGKMLLKAYIRHPSDLAVVAARLTRAFGAKADLLYLQADICRADLLVEVEGTCLQPAAA